MHETLGTSSVRNTTYAFDQARRLTAVNLDVRGDGSIIQTVSYQYDAGGLRTQLTMPDGKTVSYTYDARGQLVGLSDWNAQAVRYDYDNAGRLSAVERPNGLRSGYQYDAGSRLTQLRHTAASKTLAQFDYVPGTRGNRIKIREAVRSATSGNTVLTNTDPAIGYPQGTWNPINNFSVSTDVSAALHVAFMGSQLTLQLGQGPDHGLCDLYIDDALYQTFDGYAATATDVPLSLTIGLSNDGPHTLDIRNRAERNTRASAFKVRFFSLTLPIKYDLHTMYFNRTSVINGTTTITTDGYDTASRLYFVDYFPGDNLTATPYLSYDYNYDRAGNRLAQTVTQPTNMPAKVTSTFTYNAANHLLTSSLQNQDINGNPIGSPTSTSYQYDNNGNQINLNNAAIPVYQWDRANRLQTYTDPTTTLHYTYNGMGQRLHQDGQTIVNGITGTSTTDYVLDTQPGLWKVLQATTGSTSITSYVHGPSGLQQQYNPSAPTAPLWMVPDGLGSVRSVADNTAMPQETRFYDPYGTPTQTSGTSQTVFGFTGEETDTNGLLNLRARYYNPAIGQFMSLDPLEGGVGQPMSLNRYSYVQGNPINWTDPLGYGPEICAAALIGGPEAAAACLAGAAIIAVGGAALAYLAFRASRSTQKINIYSSGIPGNLSLDQSIQQYSQIFNSLERARSQDCSGLTPGGDRERCNQRYAQREREALEQTVIPGFIGEADYVLQEIEDIIKEVARKPQPQPEPGQTMIPPYIPPLPPTLCSPTPDNIQYHIALGFNEFRGANPLLSFFKNLFQDYKSKGQNNVDISLSGSWQSQGLSTTSQFPEEFNQATINSKTKYIHFNLEGMLSYASSYVEYANKFSNNGVFVPPSGERSKLGFIVTAWELYKIKSDPNLCQKTYFYERGSTNVVRSEPPSSSLLNQQICGK